MLSRGESFLFISDIPYVAESQCNFSKMQVLRYSAKQQNYAKKSRDLRKTNSKVERTIAIRQYKTNKFT